MEELIEQEQERPPKFSESLEALHAAGIREPKASQLAWLPHVTPEFIRLHIEQARRQGHPTGTAIYRIENAWQVEPPAQVEEQDRRKYIEGKYAEFIEH